MQVITGKFKGRKLLSVDSPNTRPTLGRVKESMFDLLNEYIYDSKVLDLFAGSGALGIECLSRGAKSITFVDKDEQCLKVIKRNLKNILDNVTLIKNEYEDALHNLSKQNEKFNLVLLDPPFDSDYLERTLYLLHKKELLEDGAIILCEKATKKVLQNYPQKYIILKTRSYGTISVTIFEYKKG